MHTRGSVILAEKCGSCRHSTTIFSESVIVAGTSYQMLEVLAFCNWERAQPSSIAITVLTSLVEKKYNEKFWGIYFLTIGKKNFKSSLVLVVILNLESKGP